MKNCILYILTFFIPSILFGQEIEVISIDINTDADEFAPCYYEDGLTIVSNRKNTVVKSIVELGEDGKEQFLNDLYFLSSNDELELHEHFQIEPFEHNRAELHEGPAAFNSTYDYMVLSETIKSKNPRKNDRVGLFYSKKEGEHWTEPKLIPFRLKKYSYSQPSLSEDGNTLYFVSNLSGGQGGMDIWYSNKVSGKWSEPINMGAKVNSPKNDIFPFAEENKLFFSSNRRGTFGGYDIFSVDLSRSKEPRKIEEPINSSSDEYGFITKDFGRSGYFGSNRNGSDDVFKFNVEINFPDTCEGTVKASRCFLFSEDDPSSDTLPYKYKWDFGDGEISSEHKTRHCFRDAGKYVVKLSLIDTIYNLEIANVGTYEIELEEQDQFYIESFIDENEEHSYVSLYNKECKKIGENTIWKVGEELFYREDDLELIFERSGNYEVEAYNKNQNDSACYKSIIWVDGVSKDEISLVPNTYDKIVNKKMKYWMKECLNKRSDTKFILKASQKNVNLYNDWVNELSNYIKDNYGSTLIVDVDQRVEKFLLSVN